MLRLEESCCGVAVSSSKRVESLRPDVVRALLRAGVEPLALAGVVRGLLRDNVRPLTPLGASVGAGTSLSSWAASSLGSDVGLLGVEGLPGGGGARGGAGGGGSGAGASLVLRGPRAMW